MSDPSPFRPCRGVIRRESKFGDPTGKPFVQWAYITPRFPNGIATDDLRRADVDIQAETASVWFLSNFKPHRYFAGTMAALNTTPLNQAPEAPRRVNPDAVLIQEFGDAIRAESRQRVVAAMLATSDWIFTGADAATRYGEGPYGAGPYGGATTPGQPGTLEVSDTPLPLKAAQADTDVEPNPGNGATQDVASGVEARSAAFSATLNASFDARAVVAPDWERHKTEVLNSLPTVTAGLRELRSIVQEGVPTDDRFGIGGNSPPEALTNEILDETIDAAEALQPELSAPKENLRVIRVCASTLKHGAIAALRYIGQQIAAEGAKRLASALLNQLQALLPVLISALTELIKGIGLPF